MLNKHLFVIVAAALALVTTIVFSSGTAVSSSREAVVEKRIDALLAQMSLEEKVSMLAGVNDFDTRAIPRLGIPSIKMADGPLGVRQNNFGKNTAFPAGIAMGASFDPELIREVAKAIADETRVIGKNMLLGPCVNISRNPFGGRNFESFGEDPYLSSRLAEGYVKGIQGQHVLASVKHFALNEQEVERMTIDVKADPRAMFELHFPAFKAAIDAGSWTVMASYNKVNGWWASENAFLNNKVLKEMWGFRGFVVSDWGATHSTIDAANNGLDLEMPSGDHFNDKLIAAVRKGQVKEELIDDKVRRLLRAMFGIGLIDPALAETAAPAAAKGPESKEHQALALKLAQESIVLLKNERNTLPIDARAVKSLALVGPNADVLRANGGGSSRVNPFYLVSPLQGFRERALRSMRITHAQGVKLPGDLVPISPQFFRPDAKSAETGLLGEYFNNTELKGTPMFTRIDKDINVDFGDVRDPRTWEHFSVRWTGYITAPKTGRYTFTTWSDDGVRLFIDGKEVISNWTQHEQTANEAEIDLVAGKKYEIKLEYYQTMGLAVIRLGWEYRAADRFNEAVLAAKNSDMAVVFAGLGNYMESEGSDRPTMDLPPGQVDLIKAVAAANPRTVVVLFSGNPLPMGEWINDVEGVVHAWYPGQDGGRAIADVLLGHVNPSGKLPVSFLKRWEDSAAYGNYPGKDGTVHYAEGLFVGYRHHEAKKIAPEFPFGHGLSYTQFKYDGLSIRKAKSQPTVRVEFTLTNTGSRAGSEVAQVYVGERKPVLARPVKELKGFRKVALQPGETKALAFDLDAAAFSYFDEKTMSWKLNPGAFDIFVGSSSSDIRLQGESFVH